MNRFRLQTEALVIGSGIAGASAALTLAENGVHVTLLTAGDSLFSGNTRLAQGGIVYESPEPGDQELLEQDILSAGHRQNYLHAVRHLAQHGPEVLRETLLSAYPVPFEKKNGEWARIREGGHSAPRILYCADHTGRSIMETLAQAIENNDNIRVLTRRTAVDLLSTQHHAGHLDFKFSLDNQCVGAYVHNQALNQVETILADATVLATGGLGQVYLHTTNSRSSIGSGVAMAFRAGARIMHAEYVQFHPTTLFQRRGKHYRRYLISEALRGEGAKLVNSAGEPFMDRFDPRGDLAPRDVVTRAIMNELLRTGEDCVYLDAAHFVDCDLTTRFPTICGSCAKIGVDPAREPIPVVPAAHYFCGGVLVNQRGRTTLDRLYAAGECACSGVHGANRLASTSLLEGLLWGVGAARDIVTSKNYLKPLAKKLTASIPDWESPGASPNDDPALIAQDWASVRHTMWNYVGVTRSTQRLNRAFSELRSLFKNIQDFYKRTTLSKPVIDLFHGCQTAYIVAMAAMRNKQSIGCHHRED
ncbi:MAG: L-aspartate oxidase [Desulfovibrionaceae bacterium]